MRNIAVIGLGYVGIVTGAGLADLGNHVTGVDVDEERLKLLERGELPIYEPGLLELVERNVRVGRLRFTRSYEEALKEAEFAFIAVGTPSGLEGEADLQHVRKAANSIGRAMRPGLIIVNKSTVPVGTGDFVAEVVRTSQQKPMPFSVVSSPEFLREGSAIADFMNPARTVLGSEDREAAEKVAQLHLPLRSPIMITDLRTAEMIKYASNAFLATKISFINEMANLCEALGADIKEVAVGMGYDPRISPHFLDAGLGYGGSCFPKDVRALAFMAAEKGRHPQLLQAVMEINADQRKSMVEKAAELLGGLRGKVIGLLGLSFKPNTDDLRDAPALEIAERLREAGATVRAYDPVAMIRAASLLPNVEMAADVYALARGADALIVCTEWNEFQHLDLDQVRDSMRQPVLIDGRNLYDPERMARLGFRYRGVGRGSSPSRQAAVILPS